MDTRFAISPDGTRIAYDCNGSGPGILLLHGGGGSRLECQQAGYIQRLQTRYTLIAMDLRGHGDSDMPTDPAAYTPEALCADILSVADACGLERFDLWGMSYGGKVGRYLAARLHRIRRCVLMGTPLGPGVVGQRRQEALDFVGHWPPILAGLQDGTLDSASLSPQDRGTMDNINVPVVLAWATAMLDWPSVEPADFLCPTLWLVGAEDIHAVESVEIYRDQLPGSQVQVEILPGLDHMGIFDGIEFVLPLLMAFMEY
jgi:pimeloyl-ACP methyl ester carboxylesterase